ncbi:MAG: DUF6485 family protein [Candidatus Omnitrophica bacterium]|nr:DUF6485 family protein [Candidatus Omnitrophota bacterium]
MSCENKKKNTDFCSCSYPGCPRKGVCCECLQYHLANNEIPGCLFPPEAEKTYNRSRDYFISICKDK